MENLWRAGIAIAGMLLLSLFMVSVPVSATGAYEGTSGLATPGTGTVQATPTANSTIAAETANEQLRKLQRDNERSLNAWVWNNGATILSSFLSALVIVGGALFGFWRWRVDRRDAQDKELKAQAEERFKTAVTALGDEKESVQVGGAILLRSFLHEEDEKSYERYYTQIFDLAVAHLRPPDNPPPLTPLRQALTVVFKEAFPLARNRLVRLEGQDPKTQFHPQSLDASHIQLDHAYLRGADLKQAWMPQASLRNVDLRQADLSQANLQGADLSKTNLDDTRLSQTDLHGVRGLDPGELEVRRGQGAIGV